MLQEFNTVGDRHRCILNIQYMYFVHDKLLILLASTQVL
jgi:hypothetical protein